MKIVRYLHQFAQCGAIAVLFSVSQLSAQQIVSASSVKISTDSAVVRPASAPLQLGWNVPWQKFQIHFWDSTTQTADADVQAYLAANMQGALYRYPGGTIAKYFDWRETIGPVAGRTAQFTNNQGYIFPYFGVDEFLRLVESLGGQPVLQVPLQFDGHPDVLLTAEQIPEWAQRAADLVEYCNAPNDGSNPGGGIDWAAVRATNGHPAPYKVLYWELDNETDNGASGLDVATYADRCAQFIAAMRAVDPNISIIAHSRSILEQDGPDWRDWHQQVITALGGGVDLIAAHPYYDGIQVPTKLNSVTAIRADALALAPSFAPTVAVTEHATWTALVSGGPQGRNSSIVGAIGTSDFIMGSAQREGIALATMHGLDGSGWWRAFSKPGTTWQPRPVSRSLSMMHAILRDHEVLQTTVETPNNSGYNGGYDVRGIITRKPGTTEYAVGFVNRYAGSSYPAVIALEGLRDPELRVTLSYLSDPTNNLDSLVNLNVQSATQTGFVTRSGTMGSFTVTLPPRSVGTLTFTTNAPPSVSITSPANGTTRAPRSNITIDATASDSNGAVTQVEFFQGSTSLGIDTTAPYSVTWTNVPAGTYSLTAVATDNIGAATTSTAVTISVGDTYQAESASYGGGVTIDTLRAGFNGTGYANFPLTGGFLQFDNVEGNGGGANTLSIRYALGDTVSRTGLLVVNGVSQNITFAPTGSWTTWAVHNVNITLNNSATNTMRLESTGQDLGNTDEITIAKTYQAESASYGGGVTIDTLRAGFNGTGYANFPLTGGFLQFNNVDGNGGGANTLSIRYALGDTVSRTGLLVVNGVSQNITFAPTASWTTWAAHNVNITLNNNATNTIRIESTGQDLGNTDEIAVASAGSPPPN